MNEEDYTIDGLIKRFEKDVKEYDKIMSESIVGLNVDRFNIVNALLVMVKEIQELKKHARICKGCGGIDTGIYWMDRCSCPTMD